MTGGARCCAAPSRSAAGAAAAAMRRGACDALPRALAATGLNGACVNLIDPLYLLVLLQLPPGYLQPFRPARDNSVAWVAAG